MDRRAFLIGSTGMAMLAHLPSAIASSTDIEPYLTPAIATKAPSKVLLEAITNAGSRLVAVGQHGVIILSDDYGKTWIQAKVPVDVTLTCVEFVTPFIGWSAGHFGVILKTEDGGRSWELQLDGIKANELTLAAAKEATAQNSQVPGAALALRRSEFFMKGGPDLPFLSILVLGTQKVIAFGAYRMTMITTDGGKTWADWSLHIYDRLSNDIYDAVLADGNIYVVGGSGKVFLSKDDGNTFLPLSSPADVTLFGVLVSKNGSIITFGVAGSCFRSTDCGASWMQVDLNIEDNLLAGRVLKSGDILIASQTGALFRSSDDGASFSAINGPASLSPYGFIQTTDENIVFVGNNGVTQASIGA